MCLFIFFIFIVHKFFAVLQNEVLIIHIGNESCWLFCLFNLHAVVLCPTLNKSKVYYSTRKTLKSEVIV